MCRGGTDREEHGPGRGATTRPSVGDTSPSDGPGPVPNNEDLETYLCLWDVAEGITLDDAFEAARSAHFRAELSADVERGGRARESAIHDLVEGLLTWLEQPPRRSVEELMALERQEPTRDLSEALAQGIAREDLRVRWIPQLEAALRGDGLAPRTHDDDGRQP